MQLLKQITQNNSYHWYCMSALGEFNSFIITQKYKMKRINRFNYIEIAVVFSLLALMALSVSDSTVTIAIIGTNDIHGAAFPAQLIRSDNTSAKYLYGGLEYMGRLIQIIQQQNQGNVLYLDAGDQFQGGIQSSKLVSSGKIMNDFYASLDLNGSAIGNHEFDFGPQFLLPFMDGKNAPNLAANIRSQKGEDVFLPNQQISHLYEFKSGIRIGVIGLSTIETPTTTNAFNSGLFPKYQFLDYLNVVEQQSKKLRRRGADAVLLTTHVGDQCPLNFTYGVWTASTQQNGCQLGDQMSKLLDTLPKGTIDGVLQGHRHVIAHHFRNGIPYMGSINGGYYFNVMYLTFNSKKQIVNRTIEGPIPVCEKVFQNIGRCNYLTKHQIQDAGPLVNWRFHNQDVFPHPKVKAIYEQQWVPKMSPYLEQLVLSQIPLQMFYQRENQLGNIMTTIMHNALPQTDFVILNPGGFRTTWVPGVIQYQHFYNMFPFENQLRTFDITGNQLLEMLKLVQNGEKGFYQAWGIQQIVTFNTTNNKTGFVSAKMANGEEIEFDKVYRGGMTDFLLNGGDDFAKVIGKAYTPRRVVNEGEMKDLLKPQLKRLQILKQNSWIDPNNLRLIVKQVI